MLRTHIVAASLTCSAAVSTSCLAQLVPGYDVRVYAKVADPVRLAFAPDGYLYCGQDSDGGGCTAPVMRRIPPGGGAVEDYSLSGIPDPDAVAFDATGAICGVPGLLFVGHGCPDGNLVAVRPDRTSFTVISSTTLNNPSDMVPDEQGRLILTSDTNRSLVRFSCDEGVTELTRVGEPSTITRDIQGRFFAGCWDGRVRLYSMDGALLSDDYAGNVGQFAPVASSHGGYWGTDLYVASPATGELLRCSAEGVSRVVGTDLGLVADLAFGPDGALYVSNRDIDAIIRIACSADFNGDGDLNSQDFFDYLTCFFKPDCDRADFNADGFVNSQDFFDFLLVFFAGC